jgi:FMN reductase
MPDVILISGSPSATSRSVAILRATAEALEQNGLSTEVVSVRDFPAEDLVFGRWDSPAFTQAKQDLAAPPAWSSARRFTRRPTPPL